MANLSIHQCGMALNAIGRVVLTVNEVGNYVAEVEGVKVNGNPLKVTAGHNADHAIDALWKSATAKGNEVTIKGGRSVSWNGFMWS